MIQWLPVIAVLISLFTLALTALKMGREVHVDDKNEIIRRLNECESNHKECQRANAELRRRLEAVEEEKVRYMRMLLQQSNGHKPTKGG